MRVLIIPMVAMLSACAATALTPEAKPADKGDRFYAEPAEAKARLAPVGVRIAWTNPASGHSGGVTAIRDFFDHASGAYCRDIQTEVAVGGAPRKTVATFCRQPDGVWKPKL